MLQQLEEIALLICYHSPKTLCNNNDETNFLRIEMSRFIADAVRERGGGDVDEMKRTKKVQ